MKIVKYPEWDKIEAYMREDPDYDFLMSYRFMSLDFAVSPGTLRYNYLDERVAGPAFKAFLTTLYSDLNIVDAKLLSDGFLKKIAKFLLANIALQVAVDSLIPTVREPRGWTDPQTHNHYSYWLQDCDATVFASTGTRFGLNFICRAGIKNDSYPITLWLTLTPPVREPFPLDWKSLPATASSPNITKGIKFSEFKLSLIEDIIKRSIDFDIWK